MHVNGIITVPTGSSSGGLKFSGNSQIYEDSDGLHFRKMGGTDYKFKFEKDNGTVIAKLDNAGDLFVDGDVYARSVKPASDIKIKKDISDITDALSVINKLHPVRYRLIDKFLKEHESFKDTDYYNFIAQEFEKIFRTALLRGTTDICVLIFTMSVYTLPPRSRSLAG